jgi:alpha-L-arabinofuranosidase
MIEKMFAVLMLIVLPVLCTAETINTAIDINAAVTVNTFKPYNIFGNNVNGWSNPGPIRDKIQAAGNYIIRYPGGSWGDAFYWNGKGAYDADGNWVADDNVYENSRMMMDNGMRHDASKINDNMDSTAWRSGADTDFPNGQWVYIDLSNKKLPDKVVIIWGDKADKSFAYAKKFSIQYWDPKDPRQWMVYGADNNAWLDTTAKDTAGTGGTQEVKFEPVESQYIRIFMKQSSAGKNGTYSISSIKVYAENEELSIKDNNCVVASSCDTAAELGDRKIFGFEDFMKFMRAFEPEAEPLIIVNAGSGTPKLAASWVRYANITKKYGIKYWEIGNENGGQWEAGGPMNAYDYAGKYIKFYEAMKAVDPSITIIAQGQFDGTSQAFDRVPALKALADRLAKEKKIQYLKGGIVTHQYPIWGKTIEEVLACPEKNFNDFDSAVTEQLKAYPELSGIPIWITEFNTETSVKPNNISTRLENGLFIANYLGEFIKHFGSRGYTMMWDVINGGDALNKVNGADHGYLQVDDGPYQYQERATYWAMKMMTNYWSKSGDKADHRLVKTEAMDRMLAAYTDLKPDGSLAVMVINKDPKNEYKTAISITGYKPEQEANIRSFDSSNYVWNTNAAPYHADPDKEPTESRINNASEKFEYTFKPYSITVIALMKAEK